MCFHPGLEGFLDRMFEEITQGSGFSMLRVVSVEHFEFADTEGIYWGICNHFGFGHSHSTYGNNLGHFLNAMAEAPRKKIG